MKLFTASTLLLAATLCASAQQAATPPPPKGEVLFQSHGEPPTQQPATEPAPGQPSGPVLTDAERTAILIISYDLDARLTPATSSLVMRARLTLRNDSQSPLTRIALQISSTLHWESATLLSSAGPQKLAVTQHILETDADHTGKASEAVLVLPAPLAPGVSLDLDTFYSGAIPASGARLQNLGATSAQALSTDWDAISPDTTALRGFGNVLWYPVAARQLFLGNGNELFEAIGQTRLREQDAGIRLHLAIQYAGDPPLAAYFCGHRRPLTALPDNSSAPIDSVSGVAVADFATEPLGFRTPSLFLINLPEHLVAPIPSAAVSTEAQPSGEAPASPSTGISSSNSDATPSVIPGSFMLAVESDDAGAITALTTSAEDIAPMLQQWLGPDPLSALTLIDHRGQPFEDGPLLVGPAAALGAPSATDALTHSLTHAWVQTGRPWMDEGLAEFFSILWTEQEQGRERAIAQLDDLLQPLPLAEPDIEPQTAREQGIAGELPGQVLGQPLIASSGELFYRRKAAAVWFMLRNIVGDDALAAALTAWRQRPPSHVTAAQDALAFETLLEHSGKQNAAHPIDLRWFFHDWVLNDRGLPDLSIADITPRALPMGTGHAATYLVAVTVKNDGAAEAQVPVTLRSATYSTTSQLRVPGFGSATARVEVETPPDEVLVNDGTIPELRTSFHRRTLTTSTN